MPSYIITINEKENDIDAINSQEHSREDVIEELRKVWKSYERKDRFYTFEIFEKLGNDWYRIFATH